MSATSTDTWIERVRAADAEAEEAWREAETDYRATTFYPDIVVARALIVIAAELRAQRIARRPGAGNAA